MTPEKILQIAEENDVHQLNHLAADKFCLQFAQAVLDSEQSELNAVLFGKCYWCGDTKAGFYHVKCAQAMSSSNSQEFSKAVSRYQKELEEIKERDDILEEIVNGQNKLVAHLLVKMRAR